MSQLLNQCHREEHQQPQHQQLHVEHKQQQQQHVQQHRQQQQQEKEEEEEEETNAIPECQQHEREKFDDFLEIPIATPLSNGSCCYHHQHDGHQQHEHQHEHEHEHHLNDIKCNGDTNIKQNSDRFHSLLVNSSQLISDDSGGDGNETPLNLNMLNLNTSIAYEGILLPQHYFYNTQTKLQPPPYQTSPMTLDDRYKLFTIYGNDTDNDKAGLPHSTTGSLSSIITTSIASSEPEPGANGGSGNGGDGLPGHDASSIAGVPGSFDEKLALNRPGIKQEKWISILVQVSIPFFLAGIGTIGAGVILDRVKKWRVFDSVTQLFILVPALLGLKGNLDMCLATRLSTQVNLGNMSSGKEVTSMVIGNIALVQVQATVASFLVSMFAVAVSAAMNNDFHFQHVMLLTASAMFTATCSCLVLDFVLVAVILLSQKYRLNPDNLATPLAASIGDVVSISLLSFIASWFFSNLDENLWITFAVVVCYLVLLPLWVIVVLRNKYTRPVLKNGWIPVLSALFISGLGGLVLDAAVDVAGFVVFQPIINGIGGNLVSVQASKISTMLHQSSIIGIIPPQTKIFEWPWRALLYGVPYAQTSRILIAMSIPGSIVFIFAADYLQRSASTVTCIFVISYLIASLVQVTLLLYIAHVIVHAMWKWKIDPDNSSIPYLTALGDLLGSSFLALAFLFLQSINKSYGSDLNDLNASN